MNEEIILRGENDGMKFFRKFYSYYISGVKNAAQYRGALVIEEDYKTILKMLNEISNYSMAFV